LIVNNQADLVWSYILEYENWCNPFVLRKEAISQFSKRAKFNIDTHCKSEVLELALKISAAGIKEKDSLHLACALLADCDYFISTDDRVLKYSSEKMQVVNPVAFVLR